MRKIYVLLLFCLVTGASSMAQADSLPVLSKPFSPGTKPKSQHCISFVLHVPVGTFAGSHFAGAGLGYLLFTRYYTKLGEKYITLTANGGVDYYPGKKTEVAGHDFKYGGYTYLYAQAGLNVGPIVKGSISLTAGPSMGIYRGNTDFGWSAGLFGNYTISSRFAVGPGVTFKKHASTDALWTMAARALYQL